MATRISRHLEIARLSPATTSTTWRRRWRPSEHVLEIDPTHTEALASVRSLDGRTEDPRFELRRLRIELARAEGERRVELRLACARIERGQLDDPKAAVATLRQLVAESGADGPGGAPLEALLRETGDWNGLAELIEARAGQLVDSEARVAALEQAVAVYEQHLPDAPVARKEALFRRLLNERPDDVETRRRLLSLYRDAGRYEELAAALRSAIAAPGVSTSRSGTSLEAELARVLALALGRDAEAAELLAARPGRDAEGEADALLARAPRRLEAR